MLMRNCGITDFILTIEQRTGRTKDTTMMSRNNNRDMQIIPDRHRLGLMAMSMKDIGMDLLYQILQLVKPAIPDFIEIN